MRHIIDLFELSAAEIGAIFARTSELKAKFQQGIREVLLPGRVLALLFEKPSLRTRVSFEAAMCHLGGSTLFLGDEVGWGKRESTADFSRVVSQYVDVIVCRANSNHKVTELARYATCPVINGLTDKSHPCQALADLYTLREIHGSLTGLKLAYVGDANNVAASLTVACAKLGVTFAIASPVGYQFEGAFLSRLKKEVPSFNLQQMVEPQAAVKGAHAIYTDVWTSMGQEAERAARHQAFASYQVNAELMQLAAPDAAFLHCLPAHRGEEVTDEVIDGAHSAVLPQAANRLHVQKGILAWLLEGRA